MDPELQRKADERFADALEASGARDPRDYYRGLLRELKGSAPDAYEQAVAYYRETLVPSIASGDADPLAAWLGYGRRIAELTANGRTVLVDTTGRAEPCDDQPPVDGFILHLPDGKGRALAIGLPPDLSAAQQATYDLLVAGRQRLRTAETG